MVSIFSGFRHSIVGSHTDLEPPGLHSYPASKPEIKTLPSPFEIISRATIAFETNRSAPYSYTHSRSCLDKICLPAIFHESVA